MPDYVLVHPVVVDVPDKPAAPRRRSRPGGAAAEEVMGIRFTDAVAGLVAAYQAAPALAGVPVSDRMDYTIPDRAPDFIIVGHDATTTSGGVLQADALAGIFLREWSDTTTGRDETGSVNCLIACQSADVGAVAACSTRAAALLGAAEDAALAAAVSHLTFDGTTDGRFITRQGTAGLAVICAYRVSYSAPWG